MFASAEFTLEEEFRETQFARGFQRGLDIRDGKIDEPNPDEVQFDLYWEGVEAGRSVRRKR